IRRAHRLGDVGVAGGLIAIGFLLKQPAAIAIIPLALYVLMSSSRDTNRYSLQDSFNQVLSLSAGFGFVVSTAAAWLLARGLLGEAFYWTITNHAIPRIYWITGVGNTVAFTAFCLPITAGAWISCRDSRLWRDKRSERAALVCWTVVSL